MESLAEQEVTVRFEAVVEHAHEGARPWTFAVATGAPFSEDFLV
ncbi:hypothetical protein ACFU9Y_01010 [Streptomyces sp. NPDC057621]